MTMRQHLDRTAPVGASVAGAHRVVGACSPLAALRECRPLCRCPERCACH
ncbi:hypothetical protein [Luteococcus peritonei]|uniref:Uncharacterized protein n=1 Tax=Luteococcus peritonei TaxID=88874 RepID=A0ABW4S0W8_9ACTN